MKRIQSLAKKTAGVLLAAALLAVPCNAATIDIVPSETMVGIGENISLNIMISGLATEDLGVFDINLAYDPTIFEFSSINFGDRLGLPGTDALDLSLGANSYGNVNFSETSILYDLGEQPDAFSLGSVIFKGIASGTSMFSISSSSIFGDAAGDPLAFTSHPATSSVPEPQSFLMVAFGLVGLLVFQKRKTGIC